MTTKVRYNCLSFFLILAMVTGIMPNKAESAVIMPASGPAGTAERDVSPPAGTTPEPTASPTRTLSPTRSPFPTRIPAAVSTIAPKPEMSQMPKAIQEPVSGDAPAVRQRSIVVTGVRGRLTKKNTVKIQWKGTGGIQSYEIYRSVGNRKKYSRIQTVTGRTTCYEDRGVRQGKYYYKVIARKAGQSTLLLSKAKTVSVNVFYLEKPVIALKKGSDGDTKYIEIVLRKYQGSYVVIYARKEKKYIPLKIKKGTIAHYKERYRFRYEAADLTLYFKAFTYEKVKGRKIRSPFSAVKRIKT